MSLNWRSALMLDLSSTSNYKNPLMTVPNLRWNTLNVLNTPKN
uniref:Uncharacterized protein n=1 Tax=Rhizophora mucronata TaxID=61149 RepID=A0A2P2QIM8_RHIMU